jgi:hypothetical protein
MPSVSKPQATLMAMAAHHPAFAKKKGIPLKVAREFNRADQRSGILRKAGGGQTRAGMNRQNFGQGHGHSLFSTMPLQGHAMSGTQLGQADALIGKAQRAFADGGSVKSQKPQISAKERKQIRDMIERGKSDAISALRSTREMLLSNAPTPAASTDDADSTLAELSERLAMKDGGDVSQGGSPQALYMEYQRLMAALENEATDPKQQMELVDRLADIGAELEKLGVPVEQPA